MKKFRDQTGLFVAEGGTMLLETLQANCELEALFVTEAFFAKHTPLFAPHQRLIQFSTEQKITAASTLSTNKEGIAVIKQKKPVTDFKAASSLLILDRINDPGNLGTILRTADWFGLTHLICTEGSTDLYNPKTVNASRGSIFRMQVTYLSSAELVAFLSGSSHRIYGTFMEGTPVRKVKWANKKAIVLGNEAHGISAEISAHIHEKITIPRMGQGESLNVGISAAILCEHIANQ